MKVFDAFCYFNEDLILRLRLQTLWDYVDYFIIVEATYTQTGMPKPLNFDRKKFAAFESKIIYLVTENPPGGTADPWRNENAQRNAISLGLEGAEDDDWLIVSDVDEIPNPNFIELYNPKYLRGDFQQRYYSYFFNNLLIAPTKDKVWLGSKITTMGHFRQFFKGCANSVRSWKSSGLLRLFKRSYFRHLRVQTIENGGWHFTWVLSADGIRQKMSVMAHQENNRPEFHDSHYIEETINTGRDIVRTDRRYQLVPLDDSFPYPLIADMSPFSDYIRPC
jgi:beta-1,4-mannosyl-glycoprotein beta-1,4-N-acetylglucosaminyltransferase